MATKQKVLPVHSVWPERCPQVPLTTHFVCRNWLRKQGLHEDDQNQSFLRVLRRRNGRLMKNMVQSTDRLERRHTESCTAGASSTTNQKALNIRYFSAADDIMSGTIHLKNTQKFIDVEEKEQKATSSWRDSIPRVKSSKKPEQPDPTADKLASLMPMLQDYLKLSQGVVIDTNSTTFNTPQNITANTEATSMALDTDTYDIYFQDDSAQLSSTDRVAGLEWDLDILGDVDSDDDVRDDSSEDSNAEDYYTHDYPEASDNEEEPESDPWGLEDDHRQSDSDSEGEFGVYDRFY
ncbi:hypothetical protein HDV00_005787 [Rhizophlyctis rosea]|nr:hypothetical protein HDV00_005787 [Rhizophlyctis rosea]